MTSWTQEMAAYGAGALPNHAGTFSDSYVIEKDQDEHSRWRITYEVDGKKVTHTFDMGKRWSKRFGVHPFDAAFG